jgi:hypothetical protein
LNFWLAQLGAGVTLDRLEAELAASAEYYVRQGFNDTAFVNALYRDVLGRVVPPTPGEVAGWVNALNQGASRLAVTLSFISTREYRANVVRQYYFDYLGRFPDLDGLNFWVAHMQFGQPRTFVQLGLLTSDEFFNPLS